MISVGGGINTSMKSSNPASPIDRRWGAPCPKAAAAREILEQETPLKSETFMSGTLWTILEDLMVGHYFDVDYLTAYYLKLQILERRASFQVEAGKQKLESILSGDKLDG